MADHVPGSTRASGGRRAGRVGPGGTYWRGAPGAAGISGLERQYPIDLPGYGRARFDLAVPSLRWAIEVDVHPAHRETAGIVSDRRRDRASQAVGWWTSRVSADDYEEGFDATITDLLRVHARLLSGPQPRSAEAM